MKKIILTLALTSLTYMFYGQVNSSSTYVNGYYKSNGTYVQGYYRTTPNSTINDNYSTKPNVNPYTGTYGTVSPSNRGYSNSSTYNNSYNSTYSTPKLNTYTYP